MQEVIFSCFFRSLRDASPRYGTWCFWLSIDRRECEKRPLERVTVGHPVKFELLRSTERAMHAIYRIRDWLRAFWDNEHGVVLVLALVVMALLMGVGTTALYSGYTNLLTSKNLMLAT